MSSALYIRKPQSPKPYECVGKTTLGAFIASATLQDKLDYLDGKLLVSFSIQHVYGYTYSKVARQYEPGDCSKHVRKNGTRLEVGYCDMSQMFWVGRQNDLRRHEIGQCLRKSEAPVIALTFTPIWDHPQAVECYRAQWLYAASTAGGERPILLRQRLAADLPVKVWRAAQSVFHIIRTGGQFSTLFCPPFCPSKKGSMMENKEYFDLIYRPSKSGVQRSRFFISSEQADNFPLFFVRHFVHQRKGA